MRFTPKTEEEIAMAQLLPAGRYRAEVVNATEETSKKGQDMLHLELKVFAPDGGASYVHDYVSPEWFEFKLRHFAYAAGLGTDYEDGMVRGQDCIGCMVEVELDVEPANGKYGPKNVVKDYPKDQYEGGEPKGQPVTAKADPKDDDLPF